MGRILSVDRTIVWLSDTDPEYLVGWQSLVISGNGKYDDEVRGAYSISGISPPQAAPNHNVSDLPLPIVYPLGMVIVDNKRPWWWTLGIAIIPNGIQTQPFSDPPCSPYYYETTGNP